MFVWPKQKPTPSEAEALSVSLFLHAATACKRKADELAPNPEDERPLTTLLLGLEIDTTEGARFFCQSVGDSKVFKKGGDKKVIAIDRNFGLPADSSLEYFLKHPEEFLAEITPERISLIDQSTSPSDFFSKLVANGYCSPEKVHQFERINPKEVFAKWREEKNDKDKDILGLCLEFYFYFQRIGLPIREANQARNGVIQMLGSDDDLEVHSASENGMPGVAAEPGSVFVLMSDGITDPLNNEQIGRILANCDSSEECVGSVMDKAKEAADDKNNMRKKIDDQSAVAVKRKLSGVVKDENDPRGRKPEGWDRPPGASQKVPDVKVAPVSFIQKREEPPQEEIKKNTEPDYAEQRENEPGFVFDIGSQVDLPDRLGKGKILKQFVNEDGKKMYEVEDVAGTGFLRLFHKKRLISQKDLINSSLAN